MNHDFVKEHVNNYEDLKANVQSQNWDDIVQSSGVSKDKIIELSNSLAKAKNGVMVWALGLTMHKHATDNISQVANLALLRGWLGGKNKGLMPLRGHSSVQGSGEMGADPFSLPGGDYNDENRPGSQGTLPVLSVYKGQVARSGQAVFQDYRLMGIEKAG